MANTNKGIMTKRIPTLVGVLILIGGLVAGILAVNSRNVALESKAGPTESPKNVKISNLGSTTFSVTWTTDIPLTGLVKYSEDPTKINTPAGDIRDQISGTSQSYNNHAVNITGLGANKTYYFVIVSGSGVYNDNGKPFQTRTFGQTTTSQEDVINGKVIKESGDAVNGGVVFVEAEGGLTLSTITKNDGTWRLNLANSRTKEGKILTYDAQKTLLSIFVQAGSLGTATAITNTAKSKPVPDIILNKNQSFVEGASLSANLISSPSAQTTGFELVASPIMLSEQLEATGSVKVLNPATNGEIIATDRPEFRGSGSPGATIKLSVDRPSLSMVVQVDENSGWKWTPSEKLEQGQHTLMVDYTDSEAKLQKVLRLFSVLVTDQPAFTATPSATPSISETPTPTQIPTPTEISTMPATESAELTESGFLNTTVGMAILGVFLFVLGTGSKAWLERR